MKKSIILICSLILLAGCNSTSGKLGSDGKAHLKVLYVGGNPDYETYSEHRTPEQTDSSVTVRMAAFEQYLGERFSEVKTVKGTDYTADMSDAYDVTIFDGKTPELVPGKFGKDKDGEYVRRSAQALPEDFDRAAITIGRAGEQVTQGIGCKNDWYCLCLRNEAHHWNADHQIFKGPFPVTVTAYMAPTPENAYHYEYYYDAPLPDSTLMWKVHEENDKDGNPLPIGMVSRPGGYLDSPDCEVISSGVCAKTIDAVAIGRHANFMTWGFAASPEYMTDEAKAVFANAIVYMAQFNGRKMIARKYNENMASREFAAELKYLATMPPYEERVGWAVEANEKGFEMQKAARAKKARGEKLDRQDEYYLNFKPQVPMTLSEYLERYEGDLYKTLGDDMDAYGPYIDENIDYLYGGFKSWNLVLDEDCKAWGIANNDVKLLDKAITCLETGEDVERAQRVLDRYTMCTFTSPSEWRAWYRKYSDRMFFTESGGWVFLVNGPDTIPGNDYSLRSEPEIVEEIKR